MSNPLPAESELNERRPKWSWGPRAPQAILLSFAFLVLPFVAVFASAQMTALLILIGGLMLLTNPVSGLGPLSRQHILLPVLGLLVWGVLSGFWVIEGVEFASRIGKLAGLTVLGVLAIIHAQECADRDKRMMAQSLGIGCAILLLLYGFERMTDSLLLGLFTDKSPAELFAALNRPGSILVMLVWPTLAILAWLGRPTLALWLIPVTLASVFGSAGMIAFVALFCGILVAASGAILPRFTTWLLAILIPVGLLLSPVFVKNTEIQESLAGVLEDSGKSIRHRLIIWDFTGSKIAEAPLLGHGLASSRHLPGSTQSALDYVQEQGITWTRKIDRSGLSRSSVLSLHPHNGALQIWVELGILGIVLISTFCVLAAFACNRGDRWQRSARFGLFTTTLFICLVSYGQWQSWWVATLFFSGAAISLVPIREGQRP